MTRHAMTKTKANPKVDVFLSTADKWRAEIKKLRTILLGFPMTEELKWSKPCYAFQGSNVVIIVPLKASCSLLFCKGALLKDGKGILTKPGENTQSARWLRFASVREIGAMRSVLKAYVQEAIEAEKAGLKVYYKKTSEYKIPEELQNKMAENPALRAAFKALTPGRQRAYLLYFSAAKQSKTRESRVEKCTRQILKGKGLND
jgi:uncharacterized protein YdeI (YjbR/CyaY-like superfamily)